MGARASWFHAHGNPVTSRKRWIAGGLESCGELVIDAGAVKALKDGKSLLPAGIKSLSGDFARGDVVTIKDQNGEEIGRGLSAYNIAKTPQNHRSPQHEIAAILGYQGRTNMIHRDDMVVL